MDGGVDPHRGLVRVLTGDLGVHVEQVAVLGLDGLAAHPTDGLAEVEVDTTAADHLLTGLLVHLLDRRADTAALVAAVLGLARRDVTRDQVAERRVDPLQVVVAVLLGDLARVLLTVLGLLGHPDAAVVAQRLRHQRQLRLVVAVLRDARRVDLRVAGVAEVGTALVRPPGGGHVGAHGVRRQEEDVAVAAGGQDDHVGVVGLDRAGDHVAHDDAAGAAVGDDDVLHLVACVHRHGAGGDLTLQRLVGADQQLLARLAAGVERTRDLHATERAVVEQTTVLAGERHALRDALVDDVRRHLGEAVAVRLAGAVVAALDGVVEEAVGGVTVVAVVLRRVDATLRGDGMRTPRAVLVAEVQDVVAHLAQRGGSGAARQPGADDDDVHLATVGRVHQLGVELPLVPHLLDGAVERRLGVMDVVALEPEGLRSCRGHSVVLLRRPWSGSPAG
ncbi:hypothetical protein SDC9_89679 [bioreactor metagenome]|uniref:NAD-specific glutamate dehydrogenase n=1 Tax=bioreactor metagenome TaxID=1076179 RepID=A0A644ZQH5_9ZZZZ